MSSDDAISPPDAYQLDQQSSAVDVSPAFQALDELQESGEVTSFKVARLRAKYSEVCLLYNIMYYSCSTVNV